MTKDEKIEWASRAFREIARECMEISDLEIVGKPERNTWRSIASKAERNVQILKQS